MSGGGVDTPVFEALEPRLLMSGDAALLPGDANGDGTVDGQDLSALKAYFGQAGQWGEGDFTADGLVDGQDFSILKAHFGETLPAVTPEPETEQQGGGYVAGAEVAWRTETLDGAPSLVVLGTDANDAITVSRSGGLTVIIAEGHTYALDNTFAGVRLYGFGGDDLLVSISGAAEAIWGGAGFDSFWTDSLDSIGDVEAAETAAGSVHMVSQFYGPNASMELAGQNLADPYTPWSYKNFSGLPVFADGPEYDDITQGGLGDCYLLAALSSTAQSDPGIIRQMVAPMGDGTYAVRFYQGGKEVYLRLDADLPTRGGYVWYANLTPENELWVALAEKAYAQFAGGGSYPNISGGWMTPVYSLVTGQTATATYTSGLSAKALLQCLTDNLNAGHAVTAGSYSTTSVPICASHAYVVRSVASIGGQWYVNVYNPWHQDGFNWDSNTADGLLTISLAMFQQNFSAVCVSLA